MALHDDKDLDEEQAVEKLLRAVPKKYAQLKIAIETLLDFQDLTIEDVTGRLKTVDDLEESVSEPISVGGKLMLTEEQWLAWQKKKGGNDSGSTSSSKEPGRQPRGGRKQKPKGERDDRGDSRQGEKAGSPDGERKVNRDNTCLNCHRTGHWVKDYPQPRRERGGAAHLTEADDDEATLFLAHGFLELEEHVLCSMANADLDLNEPRARAFLNTGSGEDKLDGWYLDSGATHHMTGRRELFSDLDTTVRGLVRFDDASKVEIQGINSIVF
jgi:hypothetical protein